MVALAPRSAPPIDDAMGVKSCMRTSPAQDAVVGLDQPGDRGARDLFDAGDHLRHRGLFD
jgi:hypothetical protein